MNSTDIVKRIDTIQQSLRWKGNVPTTEQLTFQERLINLRREYKKIKFALDERPSVAAFGESQMGKSYLVSAMLSSPNVPFRVTDGTTSYHFIDEINPSSPNSTIEATGVITRFTTLQRPVPKAFLRAQLLSVADLILVLCEAYYNQVDYSHSTIIGSEEINSIIEQFAVNTSKGNCVLSEDDILDIREYLQTSTIQKKCHSLLNSNFFDFMLVNISKLSMEQFSSLVKLMWNNSTEINRLYDDLIATYSSISFNQDVFVEFKSVLKKHGTLLDVARLDEMYGNPEVCGDEFIPVVNILVGEQNDHTVQLKKSFFSALIAELTFMLPTSATDERDFLNYIDILDFPGARRPEQIKETKLSEGKNLSTILRRGKVSYLFFKYSKSKRITSLLFCHNNNQSAESTMGTVLTDWVLNNVGDSPVKRNGFIESAGISPLFIIGTWFNKDLEYQNETRGVSNLNERWQRRFNVVLEKEVLKSGDPTHWFNQWSSASKPFANIFMLRDFKYSTMIFKGYNPEESQAELGIIVNDKYPTFLEDVGQSFIENSFVKLHFDNPSKSWDDAATVGNDGTRPIIAGLCQLAPNAATAREEKLSKDYASLNKRFVAILEQYYHPEETNSQLKQAKKQAGEACLLLDRRLGNDPYFFGRTLNKLMISQTELFELVHKQILGAELPTPMSSEETSIYMGAGLDAETSREDNIMRLCDYLGVEDEEECREALTEQGIDIEKLLTQSKMVNSCENSLVTTVEELWHQDFLAKRCISALKDIYDPIDMIVNKLWTLYKLLNIHEILVEQVRKYMRELSQEASIGIIADYLAMQLNAFVNSFGYDFIPENERGKINAKNNQLHLGIKEDILSESNMNEGLQLLADLDKKNEILTKEGFSRDGRVFLARFPQYKSIWQWQQQLRVGYIYACQLPDYDPRANAELGNIISTIK